MRIVHTSDWHLGHELHGFDRGFEHDAFLDWPLRLPGASDLKLMWPLARA